MAIIKVLCAEDDRLMRLEMKEKMTAKGWEVIEAVDGKEALVKYKKRSMPLNRKWKALSAAMI